MKEDEHIATKSEQKNPNKEERMCPHAAAQLVGDVIKWESAWVQVPN